MGGYQSVAALQNLNTSLLSQLEESMRSFPILIAKYVEANNIQITTKDELRILSCFNDGGTINLMDKFGEFAFRIGDRFLLLQLGEYFRANCKSLLEFCNPNAKQQTICTVIGSFYGTDNDGTDIKQGMKDFITNYM